MFNFNKQLTALAFSTLIATGITVPAVAAPRQTAEQLCPIKPGLRGCTVSVIPRNGVAIRSGPGSNYKKIGTIPYGYADITATKSSRYWVKLINGRGWIHSQYLEKLGDN